MIYHIVVDSDFRAQFDGRAYTPPGLHQDGFVHCAFERSVVPVANDYFVGAAARVLVLEIDPTRLTSETRTPAAALTAGGGTSHLASASQFPHVYGPINKEAITAVGVLSRTPGAMPGRAASCPSTRSWLPIHRLASQQFAQTLATRQNRRPQNDTRSFDPGRPPPPTAFRHLRSADCALPTTSRQLRPANCAGPSAGLSVGPTAGPTAGPPPVLRRDPGKDIRGEPRPQRGTFGGLRPWKTTPAYCAGPTSGPLALEGQ